MPSLELPPAPTPAASSTESNRRLAKLEGWLGLVSTPNGLVTLLIGLLAAWGAYQNYTKGTPPTEEQKAAIVNAIKAATQQPNPTTPANVTDEQIKKLMDQINELQKAKLQAVPPAKTSATDAKQLKDAIERLKEMERKVQELSQAPTPTQPPTTPPTFPTGAFPSYAAAMQAARERNMPVAVFIGSGIRPIEGVIVTRVAELWGDSSPRIVLATPDGLYKQTLQPVATDATIFAALKGVTPTPADPFRPLSIASR